MNKSPLKVILRIVLLAGVIISLAYVPWPLLKGWLTPLPDTVEEQVHAALDHGFDGIVVYVDTAAKDPEFYAAGWKDRDNRIPADPHALFKLASISKLYVAVAITKLVGEGQLSLDDSLAVHFPELLGRIENAETISVRQLVQHRSGIPNYTDHPGYWMNPPDSREETLALVLDRPADFEPGQGYGYSNTNYLLLRELMERVLGYRREQYTRERILIPLGLERTFFSLEEVDIDDVMSGYYVGYDADLKTEEMGMLASAQDLGVFLRALNDGSVFEEREQDIYASIYVYNHTGLIPGYMSFASYHEDLDTVIVQFVNTTDFEGYTWSLANQVFGRIKKILSKKGAESQKR